MLEKKMKRLENMCMMIETKKILSMKLLVSLKRNSKHIKLTYFKDYDSNIIYLTVISSHTKVVHISVYNTVITLLKQRCFAP